MRIAISGTYSTGKTTTSYALAHLTGIPRTHAKTMRELLPDVAPGSLLEQTGITELIRHARRSYDVFIHLPIEFPLVADGHRPVSEEFRHGSSDLLLATLRELDIPVHVIGGDIPTRLNTIVSTLELPTIMSVEQAVDLAQADLAALDTADEVSRTGTDSPRA